MATASPRTPAPLAVGAWDDDGREDSKSERYLAKRLAAAGADYKSVAWTTFLLAAAVAALVWAAGGILLEHWLIAGGLPRWARWTWLLGGVAALAAAAMRWVVPLLRYRVNLVYAARAIEREHPELHNDLVNTVLVKAHPEGNAATIVRSLERRTAKRLSTVPGEAVMDRTSAVRLAYALAALVGLACLYGMAAPKSMLTTAARLLAPWARIAAPSRVQLEQPRLAWRMPGEQPGGEADDAAARGREIATQSGSATAVRGRQVVVSTVIRGLRRDEAPTVLVTPLGEDGGADAGAVPWRAEMVRGGDEAGGVRYRAILPDATRGLDRSLEFTILAGDARSEPIRVAAVDSPSLLVREVRYEFPAYMHREPETVAWQGDLRGVEGTRVVIVAESNQPLESAWIDFDCDGKRDLKLKVGSSDLARASGSFVLALDAGRKAAEHASYRLLFQPRGTALAGREQMEAEKIEHRIEVVPDLAPEIAIEEPRESPLRVPPQAPLTVRVRALDPDFGLARVAIETRVPGGAAPSEIVLPDSDSRTAFTGAVQIVPERLGVPAGGVLEYRGVAVDTRPQEPNVARTPWQSLQIDAAAAPRPPEKAPPSGGAASRDGGRPADDMRQGGEDGHDDRRDDGRDDQRGGGERGDAAPKERQPGKDGDRGADQGERQPGKDQAGDARDGDARQGKDPQQGDAGAEGRQNEGRGQMGKQPPAEKPGDQKSGEKQGEPQPGQQNGPADGDRQGGDTPQNAAGSQKSGQRGQQGRDEGQGERGGQGQGANDSRQAGGKQAGDAQGRGQRGAGRSESGQPDARQPRDPAAAGEGAGKQPGDAAGEARNEQGQAGERGADGRGRGQPSREGGNDQQRQGDTDPQPKPAVAADGTNDGEAMDRLLAHRRQTQKAGGEKAGGEKAGGEKAGGEKAGGEKAGGEKAGGEKAGGEKGGQAASDGKPTDQAGGCLLYTSPSPRD